MPPHRDRYRILQSGLEFIGRIEGSELEEFDAQLARRGETTADFNFVRTYVSVTEVHEDGECNQQIREADTVLRVPIPASTQELLNPDPPEAA